MTEKTKQVMEAYIKLRDKRSALKARYEEMDAVLKQQQELLSQYLLKTMNAMGSDTIKNEAGTAYISVTRRFNCADWPGFWAWINEHGRPDLLEKRVLSSGIEEYMEQNGGEIPPFLNVFSERNVNIRRK